MARLEIDAAFELVMERFLDLGQVPQHLESDDYSIIISPK